MRLHQDEEDIIINAKGRVGLIWLDKARLDLVRLG
jgi:hypothetical protein